MRVVSAQWSIIETGYQCGAGWVSVWVRHVTGVTGIIEAKSSGVNGFRGKSMQMPVISHLSLFSSSVIYFQLFKPAGKQNESISQVSLLTSSLK